MKILFSIIINSLILFVLAYFLQVNESWNWITIAGWVYEYNSLMAIKTYLLWWIILWTINLIIKPILKIIKVILFFISGIITLIVNAITLFSLNFILKDWLIIDGVWYHIEWVVEFIIAVIIFTILNMIFSLFFKK